MENQEKKLKKAARNVLLFLLAFLGLGALYGGGTLIISPSGELLGMPLSMLDHSPFNNFLIPGIILFVILGVVPIGVSFALVKKPESKFAEGFNCLKDMYWAWTYIIYICFALIIWIQIEMVLINSVHWSHTLYMFWALIMLFLALLPQVRSFYKK